MPRLVLYPFRYRAPLSGHWAKARYLAELHEITARHRFGDWEITGAPEIRDIDPRACYFHHGPVLDPEKQPPVKEPPQPKKPPAKEPPPKDRPVKEPALEVIGHGGRSAPIDAIERFLVRLFPPTVCDAMRAPAPRCSDAKRRRPA